jgi:lipoprotein-anchoring transpeptidase ErfK/SrfK
VSLTALLFAIRTLAALGRVEPLDGDPIALSATEITVVETHWSETGVRARPWTPSKRVGTLARGARLQVRGTIESRDNNGCHGKPWFAVYPFGFVCSEHVRRSKQAAPIGKALPLGKDRRLPYDYVLTRGESAPMYASVADIGAGKVARTLPAGMNLAVARSLDVGGTPYIETVDGMLVGRQNLGWLGQGSDWSGVALQGGVPGPAFAWTLRDKTPVFAAPERTAVQLGNLPLRARVALLEESGEAEAERWWQIAEDQWVQAAHLAEVMIIEPPDGVLRDNRVRTGNDQWIDVDLGEQVLVAYRGAEPVYATLVASGKGSPTPRGNYPIWAKVASMTMANQDYEDKPYMVEHVPWVLLFQGHNALHGAYWHDRFGNRRSHGCVNLAPRDARWVFEWVAPTLPLGWTGYIPADLDRSVVVHVRDSSLPPAEAFIQERPIGPPDPEEEKRKVELAEQRRAEQAAAEQATEAATVPATDAGQ